MSAPLIPATVQTHHDLIPVYGNVATIYAVQSGAWADVATWSEARLPNGADAVCIPVGCIVTIAPVAPLSHRVSDLERRVGALEAGQIATPAPAFPVAPADCLDLVIAGQVDASAGFALTARTITVMPGGGLTLMDAGQITFQDVPIDTAYDPTQIGHGLLVVDGRLTIQGQIKTPWATVAQEIRAGDQAVQFAFPPEGWAAGDVLVIPDTRQPSATSGASRTERAVVATVSGATVFLTSPLQHDHFGWRNQQGVAELLPDVGNLTRSIVVQSVNPAGTRAHILLTGRSDVTARYAELRDLGRTTTAPLNSTTRDAAGTVTHVGTNQIGRYAWHFHHCLGPLNSPKPYQFEATGLAIRTSPKWGIAIHGSHYGYVGSNVIDGANGAGIVTETVSEYASVIERNLIIGGQGSGQRITARSNRNDPVGDFWHGNVGLGLTSATCVIVENHVYACQDGIGMSGFRTTIPKWPAFRGADPITNAQPGRNPTPYSYPFDFPTHDNQVWGCWRGIETWTADCFPDTAEMFPGLTLVQCRRGTDFQDQQETTTKRWRILGDFIQVNTGYIGNGEAFGLVFKDGYEFKHTHIDMEIRGYDAAWRSISRGSRYARFIRCTFECPKVIYQPLGVYGMRPDVAWTGTWTDCTFLPVAGHLTFVAGLYPKYDIGLWLVPNRPDRSFLSPHAYQIRPWHDGRDLDVYHWFQSATFALAPITAPTAYGDLPPGVYTNAELIARGTPLFGKVMPANAEPFGESPRASWDPNPNGPFFFAAAV